MQVGASVAPTARPGPSPGWRHLYRRLAVDRPPPWRQVPFRARAKSTRKRACDAWGSGTGTDHGKRKKRVGGRVGKAKAPSRRRLCRDAACARWGARSSAQTQSRPQGGTSTGCSKALGALGAPARAGAARGSSSSDRQIARANLLLFATKALRIGRVNDPTLRHDVQLIGDDFGEFEVLLDKKDGDAGVP